MNKIQIKVGDIVRDKNNKDFKIYGIGIITKIYTRTVYQRGQLYAVIHWNRGVISEESIAAFYFGSLRKLNNEY